MALLWYWWARVAQWGADVWGWVRDVPMAWVPGAPRAKPGVERKRGRRQPSRRRRLAQRRAANPNTHCVGRRTGKPVYCPDCDGPR